MSFIKHSFIAFSSLLFITACSNETLNELPEVEKPLIEKENIKMVVFSDTHLMAPSLLISEGKAFEDYISHDRKMLKESGAILDALINDVAAENPDIILIPGDLTKDGAEVSHKLFASTYLQKLKEKGAQIFVIPGNHDVNNPHAVSFDGDSKQRVKSVSKEEFESIYSDFGYGKTIAKDESSLTYVAQPFQNLRILGIDACLYSENSFENDICVTAGAIKPETMNFIRQQAKDAKENGVRMIALMHHGLVEHWTMQEKLMGEYLIQDWSTYASEFADLGIQLVFTGHFHAQDVVKHEAGSNYVYDIETGSMVTYPCPYRTVMISKNKAEVTSKNIQSINYDLDGKSFQEYAQAYVEEGIGGIITDVLPLPENVAALIKPLASNAIIAHYKGDEQISAEELSKINSLAFAANLIAPGMGDLLKNAALGLWTDLKPADNIITIDLSTGNYQ